MVGFAYFAGQGTETVTDNLGNTYTRVERSDNAGVATGSLWYAPVTAAGALTTITATHPASGDNVIQALELTAGTLSAAGGGNAGQGTAATWANNKTIPANGLALGFASTNGDTAHSAGPASGTPSTAITVHRYYQGASILESSFVSAAAGATAVTGFTGTTTFASMYFLSAGAIFTPTSPWSLVGTDTGVASGAHATVAWPGRDPNTEYEWYASASDGALSTPSVTRSFTTGGGGPTDPVSYPAAVRVTGGSLSWYLRDSNTSTPGTVTAFSYGASTDTPVFGDWDGDGVKTPGLVRVTGGSLTWYLRNSNCAGAPDLIFAFGAATDRPLVGDWDGDGDDTPGLLRANWWLLRNSNSAGAVDVDFFWGIATDVPIGG